MEQQQTEEQPIWKGTSSHAIYLGTYTLCILFCWLIVPIFYGLWKWLMLRTREYEVTTERIRIRSGLFSKRTEELELYRVKDYALLEPFWLRLFKAGDIQLITHDTSNPLLVLEGVPNAVSLLNDIRKSVEICRERKRVRLAELE
jgi:uncharacterized membrane protein YdbT with pleckstrin-like domain